MEGVINELVGKRIEVNCGNGVALSGDNQGIERGVLKLECEGKLIYVDISKIVVVSETSEAGGKPGFIAQ